jgi:acetyl esterase/lipase
MFPAFLMPNLGYAVASINYRLTSEAPFPAQIDDCWSAIDWLVAHQSRYGLDTSRIGLWGGSSGAHLALLMGLGYPKVRAANCKGEIRAVCDWCGPTNLMSISREYPLQAAVSKKRMDECIRKLIGADPQIRPQLAKAASPMTYLHSKETSLLIMHGDQDEIVPLSQSQELSRKLTAAGAKCEFIVVPGGNHDFYTFDREKQVGQFFDKTVKPNCASVEKKKTGRSSSAK